MTDNGISHFWDFRENSIAGIEQLKQALKNTNASAMILSRPQELTYNQKEIESQQALFVVNLEPKKIMGEISEGMVFDIGYADKITPVLAVPEKPVPNGARAG